MVTVMGMAAGAAAGVWLLAQAARTAAWAMFGVAVAVVAAARAARSTARWAAVAADLLLGPTVRPRA